MDRWSMAWAATTVVPTGEFSPACAPLSFSLSVPLFLSLPAFFSDERQRVAVSYIPASPHPFILESSHWHVVLLVSACFCSTAVRSLPLFVHSLTSFAAPFLAVLPSALPSSPSTRGGRAALSVYVSHSDCPRTQLPCTLRIHSANLRISSWNDLYACTYARTHCERARARACG